MIKDYFTGSFKKQIEERLQPIDTTQIQLDSLILFMAYLGYKARYPDGVNNPIYGIYGFEKFYHEDFKSVNLPMFISLQDACRLHNGITMRVVGDWVDLIGLTGGLPREVSKSLPKEVLKSAIDARLVEKVYLQRKGKGVKVQQHWIKLAD